MDSLYHYCQGESHKSTDKACQDCAFSESSDTLSMAIVSDGHGGERYFRSKYGSEFAVEITKNAIKSFVEAMEDSSYTGKGNLSVFDDSKFTAYSAATATPEQEHSKTHKSLMWLFSSIINQWNQAIADHARNHDLDDWEKEHVEQKYQDEFLAKRESEDATFEKTYGCTLMAYVQTNRYWFAFHLGDGKCVSMKINEQNELICEQPIPWDEKCFLNKTTSLCDSQALEEFRYCYQGDGKFPIAVFLGSDGMDDSYGDGDNLVNFYIQLFKIIIRKGTEKAKKELVKSLPIISQRGSKDDMSVSCVFDTTDLRTKFFILTNYQMTKLVSQLNTVEDKINQLEKKIEDFGNPEHLDNSQQINYQYTLKDLAKAKDQAKRIDYRKRTLKGEITKFSKNHLYADADQSPIDEESSSDELVRNEDCPE